mgnify:CR=1 FL=1
MNTIKVRNIEIGSGTPKIIVPIVGVTKQEIIDEAKTFDSIPVDVVEWRADWFEGVFDFEKVEDVLKETACRSRRDSDSDDFPYLQRGRSRNPSSRKITQS